MTKNTNVNKKKNPVPLVMIGFGILINIIIMLMAFGKVPSGMKFWVFEDCDDSTPNPDGEKKCPTAMKWGVTVGVALLGLGMIGMGIKMMQTK